jgi:hypothetical protein
MTGSRATGPSARIGLLAVFALACVLAGGEGARAQDLEPKAYSASPVGAAFLVLGLSKSTGSVVTDPVLPLTDVNAALYALPIAGGYTFGLFGKLALVTVAFPYAWGDVTGTVGEQARSVTRSGLTNARAKLSVNLRGNPAMGVREYVRAPRRTIVGASLSVTPPSGQYDGAKLINLGTNRWAVKPEVGVSVPKGPWDFDAYLGAWFFTDSDDFFPGGRTRSQEPVVAIQGHASYTFKPRLWAAVDATWYAGGDASIDGGEPSGAMNNSRLGATVSFPMGRFQSLKFAYSSGVAVRTGTDFRTFSVGWQFLRFTRK